jgi:hypothetical protein
VVKKKIPLLFLAFLGLLALIWFLAERPGGRGRGREPGPGWTVELRDRDYIVGKNAVVFSVHDVSGRPLRGPLVTVTVRGHFGRGRTSGGFQTADGVYRADVDFPNAGLWDIIVYVFLNGRSVTVEERVLVRSGSEGD